MRFLGLDIRKHSNRPQRVKSVAVVRRGIAPGASVRTIRKAAPILSSVNEGRGGWTPWIREPYAGAWQRNDEWTVDTVLAFHAVYSCITLIASDVGKLRPKLVEQDEDGIWSEVKGQSPFHVPLRKPNRYQNHIQFKEHWVTSKLIKGNTYVLKERDNRGIVRALYILDPCRVTPMVAPDGEIFYALHQDNLVGLQEAQDMVPASEIIHDRMNCLFHPLVGVSPIFAAGMAATVGLRIETNSAAFFGKGSNPSGILSAPGKINDDTAKRLKEHWELHYTGSNSGAVAVLGDGLKFEPMRMSAVDAQMIQHLKWSAETVCSTFHVPPFKIGVGQMPTYQNGEILDGFYYSNCLQSHIESMELLLDEGLGLINASDRTLGVELDLDGLLRMDTASLVDAIAKGVGAGVIAPDEGRRRLDLGPVEGGATPYLQQQNYSLAALNKRDQQADPFATTQAAPQLPANRDEMDERSVIALWEKAELELRAA